MSDDSSRANDRSSLATVHPIIQKTPSNEPLTSTPKAVTIFEEPEHIEPPTSYTDDSTSQNPRLYRASMSGKKMTGRPPLPHNASSSSYLSHPLSQLKIDGTSSPDLQSTQNTHKSLDAQTLLAQVTSWLKEEKTKIREHRQAGNATESETATTGPGTSLALEKLERILAGYTPSTIVDGRTSRRNSILNLRRGSIAKKFTRSSTPGQSSDTEWIDGDINVPHVEAFLDNTKTMAFSGGEAEDDTTNATEQKDQKHWDQFKEDIVRMTHTLKIRGWRRIPINGASAISVERLSGALTNAVYVVKPPKELPAAEPRTEGQPYTSKSRPLELLLRVYGPQVEHLIDREDELMILRRLARKRIGPRLLGYFTNGRFEEFLHAKTLEFEDLRVPDTSK